MSPILIKILLIIGLLLENLKVLKKKTDLSFRASGEIVRHLIKKQMIT